MAELSIIIPTYNRLWCLPQAISSCREPGVDLEIIVVDDGSTDGTWEWLQSQPDLICLRQSNLGKCWAVNRGFARSTGKYIRFLDSDDMVSFGANSAQMTVANATDADIVVSGYIVWEPARGIQRTIVWTDCDDFVAQQLGECDSSHYSAYMFRRSFIADLPHRPDFAFRDDRMFVIEAALRGPKVRSINIAAFIHRHHSYERLQFRTGLVETVTNWQHANIYRWAAAVLEAQGQLSSRRRKAISSALWPVAHWTARTHLDDACRLVAWLRELDPEFQPPESGVLGYAYRTLGFKRTEQLLALRRKLINLV